MNPTTPSDAIAAQFFDFACQMAEDYDIGRDVAKNDPDLIDACSVYAEAALRALSEREG